jgi:isobutyryl-CoA dehydrogenase
MIDQYGTPEQHKRWLPAMTKFDTFSSYCLTEPDSGSDAQAMKSFAKDMGDHFVLNGSKCFISGAGSSDLYLVMCKTGEKETSCLLLEKGMPGLSFGANEHKLGWNVQPTRVVSFDDVKVPKENLIGKRGQGFKVGLSGLDGGRLNIAACSLGGAAKCIDISTDYIKQRKQFG